eukprot:3159270-Rhodomonas_salina.1
MGGSDSTARASTHTDTAFETLRTLEQTSGDEEQLFLKEDRRLLSNDDDEEEEEQVSVSFVMVSTAGELGQPDRAHRVQASVHVLAALAQRYALHHAELLI